MTDLYAIAIEPLLTGIKAPKTVETYLSHWASYLEFAADRNACHPDTLVVWRQHLINVEKKSTNSINLRLNAVKSIFRELAEHNLIEKSIAWAMRDVRNLKANMMPERRRANNRVRIEPEQMRELVLTPAIQLGEPTGARDRALLLVLATSGVRVSEAVHIKVADIQKMGTNYCVANIMGKGQGESRIAPLSEEAYLAIKDWLHVRPTTSLWLFTSIEYTDQEGLLYTKTPISTSAAYHIVKKIGSQAGMPTIKPHDFRRFVGTQLAKTDVRKAQRALGHKHMATTADNYVLDDVPLGSTESLF